MASLKDDGPPNILDDLTPVAARGRNAYSRFNVVRTKPGRGDAPPTNAMSCSDKIALWCAVGIQGALLSSMGMTPLYIKSITISGVKGTQILEDMENDIQDDCRRAFSGRLHKPDSQVHTPHILFTTCQYTQGRDRGSGKSRSSNESLCWISDLGKEILTNGVRRGVNPKNWSNPSLRPRICKASIFAQYLDTRKAIHLSTIKQAISTAQTISVSANSVDRQGPTKLALSFPDLSYHQNRVPTSGWDTLGDTMEADYADHSERGTSGHKTVQFTMTRRETITGDIAPSNGNYLSITYYDAKHSERAQGYHAAKEKLRQIGGPLQGWIVCSTELDRFTL